MMNSMEKKETFVSAPLLKLEIRIAEHFESAARNLLGVGRCLNEAKDNGLVPHGQWEAWVQRVTGMDVRKAQRLMQAAREVPEGSVLAGLPITKITAILALPEAQREEAARAAQDESLSVRELKEKISQMQKMDKRRVEMIDELNKNRAKMDAHCRELEKNIQTLIQSQNEVISEEVEEKVAAMRAELEEAKAFAARQAELRQEAQQELLNAGMSQRKQAAGEVPKFTAFDLERAVRGFIGEAGAMPHMGAELSRMSAQERSSMKISLDRLESWMQGARKALETVVIENE